MKTSEELPADRGKHPRIHFRPNDNDHDILETIRRRYPGRLNTSGVMRLCIDIAGDKFGIKPFTPKELLKENPASEAT